MNTITSTGSTTATETNSGMAARIAITGASASLILIAALHFLKPELDPSWRFLSEYSTGNFGWVMKLSFFAMALSCASLCVALRSQVQTLGGKIGLGFLLITCAGLTMAGLFNMDLITSTPDQFTSEGNLHGLASMIGIPSLPIAAMLISLSLTRNPAWQGFKSSLLWTANSTWLSVVLIFGTIAFMLPAAGGFGPSVLIGWPNRLLMLAYGGWLMIAARQSIQVQGQRELRKA